MENQVTQTTGAPMAAKPAMKAGGKNPMVGVMPIAVMAFALVAFLVLVWISVT